MSALSRISPPTLHSTDPRWKPDNHEERLLDFLEGLIVDVAQTHPAITQGDVAGWLAAVILPQMRKVGR